MNRFLARVRVVLRAAPTYLVAASAIVTIVADEVATVLPAGTATAVGAVALRVVGVIATAVAIIRRVTPVLPSDRGLLTPSPEPAAPWVASELKMPRRNASTKAWLDYAVAVGADPDEAAKFSRDELVKIYSADPVPSA